MRVQCVSISCFVYILSWYILKTNFCLLFFFLTDGSLFLCLYQSLLYISAKSRKNHGFTRSNIIVSTSHSKSSLSHPVRQRHSYTNLDLPTTSAQNSEFVEHGTYLKSNSKDMTSLRNTKDVSQSNSPSHVGSIHRRSPRSSQNMTSAAERSRSSTSENRLSSQEFLGEMYEENAAGQSNYNNDKVAESTSAGNHGNKIANENTTADNLAPNVSDIHLWYIAPIISDIFFIF